ncbi:NAD(P)H-binding protein [Ottowia sp.]|uniref:NAD(P)H-binding protein n=1 Tax=Ottowia sp. TaxID=1898956 RepID=UPI003A89DF06
MSPKPSRTALVAGATGLVGRQIVARLCADQTVAVVHTLSRRAPLDAHPKLRPQLVDFAALPALPAVDEVYLALGTTIKVAGSQAAFRAVDFDANLAVARAALAAGAQRIGLVSALGADARSTVFYSRVKGELEDALAALPLQALVIARPSMLRGNRTALGQPVRSGEALWGRLDAALRPLIPRGLRAVDAADVAAALACTLPSAQGLQVLTSAAMQGAAMKPQ